MKPVVTITQTFPDSAVERLRQSFEVRYNGSGDSLTPEALGKAAGESDALVTYLSDKIDQSIIAKGERLKIVANYGAGFNNIDVASARAQGVWVTNTPGVLHETTADLTWALIRGAARQIVPADRYTREGRFHGWGAKLFLGHDVHGKTLGIIGCGEIGRAVARRARGFSMHVLYHQRNRLPAEDEKELHAEWVPLERVIREADFLTLHVPLTPETQYMIGGKEIAMMKSTAYLIHTARGKVVDDLALVQALREKRIAGAALDVFENEPELTGGLTGLDNCIILPHIGSASYATRETMAHLVADNVIDALEGREPRTLVPGWKQG